MHLNGIGDLAQRQGPQMRNTAPEKPFLLLDDFGRDFDDCALPLVHGLDQPIGIRHAIAEPRLGSFVLAKLGHIAAVDQQSG